MKLKTIVLKCSREVCIFPRAFHNNNLCKIWGAERANYEQFENRELTIFQLFAQ